MQEADAQAARADRWRRQGFDAAPGELLERIPEIDGLVIRSGTKVTAEVIEAGERLSVVGRAGMVSTTSTWRLQRPGAWS